MKRGINVRRNKKVIDLGLAPTGFIAHGLKMRVL